MLTIALVAGSGVGGREISQALHHCDCLVTCLHVSGAADPDLCRGSVLEEESIECGALSSVGACDNNGSTQVSTGNNSAHPVNIHAHIPKSTHRSQVNQCTWPLNRGLVARARASGTWEVLHRAHGNVPSRSRRYLDGQPCVGRCCQVVVFCSKVHARHKGLSANKSVHAPNPMQAKRTRCHVMTHITH